ncbi:hypothetical protein VB713_21150 [Anabaena cylindrica UHCC 0172]|uniref:hypothetical protein n=1 Tax=Anabaena cylindrica TaxID=1165 RepID=UPI002B20C882|nr:hypothetical protein [Anabaena cylindrica]MEA5553449.1 hypothetical protein [Anabaena cylindrica UHCC 0172]
MIQNQAKSSLKVKRSLSWLHPIATRSHFFIATVLIVKRSHHCREKCVGVARRRHHFGGVGSAIAKRVPCTQRSVGIAFLFWGCDRFLVELELERKRCDRLIL